MPGNDNLPAEVAEARARWLERRDGPFDEAVAARIGYLAECARLGVLADDPAGEPAKTDAAAMFGDPRVGGVTL